MLMTILFAILGSFMVVTPSHKAQANIDMHSFWFDGQRVPLEQVVNWPMLVN
jgi:hypothetical protein